MGKKDTSIKLEKRTRRRLKVVTGIEDTEYDEQVNAFIDAWEEERGINVDEMIEGGDNGE